MPVSDTHCCEGHCHSWAKVSRAVSADVCRQQRRRVRVTQRCSRGGIYCTRPLPHTLGRLFTYSGIQRPTGPPLVHFGWDAESGLGRGQWDRCPRWTGGDLLIMVRLGSASHQLHATSILGQWPIDSNRFNQRDPIRGPPRETPVSMEWPRKVPVTRKSTTNHSFTADDAPLPPFPCPDPHSTLSVPQCLSWVSPIDPCDGFHSSTD